MEVLACTAIAVAVRREGAVRRDSARRTNARAAIADCAEQKLAMTLMGSAAADLRCDPAVRAEMNSALSGGDVEQVTWRIAVGDTTETFTGIRHAR